MPKTAKGRKVMAAMKKTYGATRGTKIYYATENKGKVKGLTKKRAK